MLSTGVESISSIKFFNHLPLGDAVFHPTHIDELPEGTTTVMLMQKE